MAGRRVHLVWPEDLVVRVDQARGSVSRGEFVRGAVERALGESSAVASPYEVPAPAEQPQSTFVPSSARQPVEQFSEQRLGAPLSRAEAFRRATQK